MIVKACQPCILTLKHERELFGGRVGAGSLGGEPVMRAERVRSVRSSAVAAAEARRAVRVPFVPFGRLSRSACVTERSVGVYGAVGATGAGRLRVRFVCGLPEIWGEIGRDRARSGEIGGDCNLPKILRLSLIHI